MSLLPIIMNVLRAPSIKIMRLVLGALLTTTPYDYADHHERHGTNTYDFVVVGGGTAGSVVAARLIDAGATVLVLEAGGSAPPETSIPSFFPLYLGGDLDWSIPLKAKKNYYWGFNNNFTTLSLGKVLGGSSTVSAMVYSRGTRFEFNHWASLGNTGWDYDSVLPYFKKIEDYKGEITQDTAKYHNIGGPFRVASSPYTNEVGRSFLKAGEEMGYNVIDENAYDTIGFTPMHFAIRDGVRETSSEAYLRPLRNHPNLLVQTNALVTKIIFDANNHATGVKYREGIRRYRAYVSKEVLVCAGTVNSPKLLMLSGVGPKEHLEEMQILPVADVQGVGSNLQDHPVVLDLPHLVNNGTSLSLERRFGMTAFKDYISNGKGPLARPFGEDGYAWVRLGGRYNGDPAWPDVQITHFNFVFNLLGGLPLVAMQNRRVDVYDDLIGDLEGHEATAIGSVLIRPKSRGTVMLASKNPKEHPIVDHNFYSHQDDMKLMIKGIKFALAVGRTNAMRSIVGAKYSSKVLRHCKQHTFDSDDYWECFARHVTYSFFHPVGTCKMAPLSDPMGVVSNRLKVRGVSGLRVIDASVMPLITAANTAAPTLMIAEKAADLIKADWGYPL